MSEEVKEVKNEVIGGIEASNYPLELSKVLQIQESFVPKWEEKTELEKDIKDFKAKYKKEGHNPETVKEAKTLAKRAVKVRTSTDKIHKIEKSFYWEGGKLVDEFRKAIRNPIEEYEAELKEVTEKEKREEEERLEKLQETRVKELSKYVEDAEERTLNEMDEEMWEAYLFKKKADYEERLEQERIEKEKQEEEERLVELYNSRKEELIPYWSYLKEDHKSADFSALPQESFDVILKEVKEEKEKEDKRKAALEKEAEELRKKEEKRKERSKEMQPYIAHISDFDAMLYMSEQEYKKALKSAEKEYKEEEDKKAAEEKALQEKEEAERKAKNAPDKEKLEALATTINGIEMPELSTEEGKEVLGDVSTLLDKVVNYINEESNNL